MTVFEHLQSMSDERFLALYEGLESRGFGPLDGEVAKALKFRPQAIRKLPMAQRARRARKLLVSGKNVELAYELFGSYLMKNKKELITDFLEATGVEHDDGMIKSEDGVPEEGKIADAVKQLDEKFGAEDVSMYLSMCTVHWPQIEVIPELLAAR